MDKDTIIRILNNGHPTSQEAITVIVDYCLDKGKTPSQVNMFLHMSAQLNLEYYFNYALDYYKKKFEVISIIDKEGKILLTY